MAFSINKRKTSSTNLALLLLPVIYLAYRLLLPFGDEPDFKFRAMELLGSNLIDFYFFEDAYFNADYDSVCKSSWTQLSFWGGVDGFYCADNFYLELVRWINQVFVFYLFLFFLRLNRIIGNQSGLDLRYKSVVCSLFLPSMIYYGGVIGLEAFALYISLFVFLINKHLPKLALILLLALFDEGFFLVVLFFYFYFSLSKVLLNKLGVKVLVIFSSFFVLSSYFFSLNLIGWLEYLPVVGQKASLVYNSYSSSYSYVYTNYPVVLRPVITFLTGTFMLPSGFKVVAVNGIFLLFLILLSSKSLLLLFESREKITVDFKESLLCLVAPISFIVSVVFILPGHANAKYYIFTAPYLVYAYHKMYCLRSLIPFLIGVNLVVLLALFLTRL